MTIAIQSCHMGAASKSGDRLCGGGIHHVGPNIERHAYKRESNPLLSHRLVHAAYSISDNLKKSTTDKDYVCTKRHHIDHQQLRRGERAWHCDICNTHCRVQGVTCNILVL